MPEFTIRHANGLATDILYCKVELLIPISDKTQVVGQEVEDE